MGFTCGYLFIFTTNPTVLPKESLKWDIWAKVIFIKGNFGCALWLCGVSLSVGVYCFST